MWVSIQRRCPTMGWGAQMESVGTGDGLWSNQTVPHNHKFYTGVFLCHHFITLWLASGVVEFVNVSLVSGQRRMERAGLGSDDWCCGLAVPSNTPRLFLFCLFNFRGKMAPVHSLGWRKEAREPPDSVWFLLIVSASRKALTFTTDVFSLHPMLFAPRARRMSGRPNVCCLCFCISFLNCVSNLPRASCIIVTIYVQMYVIYDSSKHSETKAGSFI